MLIVISPGSAGRLDAVIDRVFQQRLQHQGRDQWRRPASCPVSHATRSRSPSRSCFKIRDTGGTVRLLARAAPDRGCRPSARGTDRPGLPAPRSARLRFAANQAQHGIDAVEQKMRPDARLQRLQPGLGQRRRKRAAAQIEVAQHQQRGHGGKTTSCAAAWSCRRRIAKTGRRHSMSDATAKLPATITATANG